MVKSREEYSYKSIGNGYNFSNIVQDIDIKTQDTKERGHFESYEREEIGSIFVSLINFLTIPLLLTWAFFLMFLGITLFTNVFILLPSICSTFIILEKNNIDKIKKNNFIDVTKSLGLVINILFYLGVPILLLNITMFIVFYGSNPQFTPYFALLLFCFGIFFFIFNFSLIEKIALILQSFGKNIAFELQNAYYRINNFVSVKMFHKKNYYECMTCENVITLNQETCTSCGEHISTCLICKLPLKRKDEIITCKNCQSNFHGPHWRNWMKEGQNCPVCNTSAGTIKRL